MNGEWPVATLEKLSIDKESARKYKDRSKSVVPSDIRAVDFDAVMRMYCKSVGITPLRSCDALLTCGELTYLIEFKNREVLLTDVQQSSGHTWDKEESKEERTSDQSRPDDLERVLEQCDLQQELIEKLYDSVIVLDGLCEDDYRLIRCRHRLIGFIVVSHAKNYALGSINDENHQGFYSGFRAQGDPMRDALAMTSMSTAVTNGRADSETRVLPDSDTDTIRDNRWSEYDGWYCPTGIRRLEGRLYRRIMFMTAGQFLQFLKRQGIRPD